MTKYILFIGVSTTNSLIHSVFPKWMTSLDIECHIQGIDLPLDCSVEEYRALLDRIKNEADCQGAVITSHKLRLFSACQDLFATIDPLALSCHETNSIRHDGDGLHAFARDPISVGRVVDDIWSNRKGKLLCLGAGGTAIALGQHLSRTAVDPLQLTFVDSNRAALAHLETTLSGSKHDISTTHGIGPWDELVSNLEPGSLIVNATGMGKDRPGSPLSPDVVFPMNCVFWELNYRGDLAALDQAHAQSERRELQVHDGFQLFCHGWSSALSAVFDIPDKPLLGAEFFASITRSN